MRRSVLDWHARISAMAIEAGKGSVRSTTSFARGVVDTVERIGTEPFHAPNPLLPIEMDEIHLSCWLATEEADGKNGTWLATS